MSVVVLQPGGLYVLDPSDVRTIAFDWDLSSLRSGVTIVTSTWTITVVKQNGLTALTKDNPSILSAIDATAVLERTVGASRATQVRLVATTATNGDQYLLANTVVLSDTPAQTKEQSLRVLIENQ